MIKADCEICGKELFDNGALLWSPPDKNRKCVKTHICHKCYLILVIRLKLRKKIKEEEK